MNGAKAIRRYETGAADKRRNDFEAVRAMMETGFQFQRTCRHNISFQLSATTLVGGSAGDSYSLRLERTARDGITNLEFCAFRIPE